MLSIERQFTGPSSSLLRLLNEDGVTDILINGTQSLFVEKSGALKELPTPFVDAGMITDFIERLLIPLGKRVDAAHPFLDGRLLDGSRFHVILPPLAPQGPLISIRKMAAPGTVDLFSFGDQHLIAWVLEQLSLKKNILIAGSTGSGKTTLLSLLIDRIPQNERIAVIEETSEISSDHAHLVKMEARAPSPDGAGEVTVRDLIRNALRMRPDRLILGECRGGEVFDMLLAMNTGHNGSLCTLHANSARDALKKIEALCLLSGFQISLQSVREWVAGTIHGVLFLSREKGARKIKEAALVSGLEGDVYRLMPFQAGTFKTESGLSICYH